MAERAEPRAQWTIKSKRIDVELQNACRMAAERQGMAMGDWCVETLRAGALTVLTGEGTPAGGTAPPARLEDVADVLSERVTAVLHQEMSRIQSERAGDIERVIELERRQEALAALADRRARFGRWRR